MATQHLHSARGLAHDFGIAPAEVEALIVALNIQPALVLDGVAYIDERDAWHIADKLMADGRLSLGMDTTTGTAKWRACK